MPDPDASGTKSCTLRSSGCCAKMRSRASLYAASRSSNVSSRRPRAPVELPLRPPMPSSSVPTDELEDEAGRCDERGRILKIWGWVGAEGVVGCCVEGDGEEVGDGIEEDGAETEERVGSGVEEVEGAAEGGSGREVGSGAGT